MEDYQEKLDIVDENDNIIGQDTRENIHQKGLLHRDVHVIIYNCKDGILFQRRSINVDTYPNLLDISVGGHVDLGETYDRSAIRELEEETGIRADIKDLSFIKKRLSKSNDFFTKRINNKFQAIYSYKLKQSDILKLKRDKATSLEFWSIDEIFDLSEDKKNMFIPTILSDDYMEIYKSLVDKK